jgi:hypothetical protein|tara:strand:+ start:3688 stop:4143 length:456 start_codon:yes stop_codon:yes gene_type:complete
VSAALAGAGWYITELLEQKGALVQKVNEANRETDRQKNITANLRVEIAREQTALISMGLERSKDNARLQKEINRLASRLKSSRDASVKHPERYGAIATFRLRRGMRSVCRSGKGGAELCKIESVRPAKAKPNTAGKPDNIPDNKLDSEATQ